LEAFALLRQICEDIMNSCSLRKILGTILHLGNVVNESGRCNNKDSNDVTRARAINISSLSKVYTTKGYDNNHTTFLQYIVTKLQIHHPHIIQLYHNESFSIPLCQPNTVATIIQFPEMIHELYVIQKQLVQLDNMANELGIGNDNNNTRNDTIQSTSIGEFVLYYSSYFNEYVMKEYQLTNTVFDQLVHYFGESNNNDLCNRNNATNKILSELENTKIQPKPSKSSLPTTTIALQILFQLSEFCHHLDDVIKQSNTQNKVIR
jgi:hypothetical protein